MALSRQQKEAIVSELSELLESSKMTAFASYQGLTVEDMSNLRAEARANNSHVKVVKNRLFKLAVSDNKQLSDADLDALSGQLVYVFSDDDEVIPAKILANFSKTNPILNIVGALSADGKVLNESETVALANLPSKNESIAQLLNTLSSPLDGIMSGLSGNLHGLLDGVAEKATA